MKKERRKWMSLSQYTNAFPEDFIFYEKPVFVERGLCQWCGKPILNKRRRSFCCDECSRIFNKITVWEKGHASLPYKILCRDKFICQKCGKFIGFINEHGVKIPVGCDASVHHIVPVRAGGLDKQENLKSLCSTCHYEEDLKNLEIYPNSC